MSVVTIGALANGGRCIAHVDGKTVFVRGAIPGETVRIAITDHKAKIAFAEVTEVIEASDLRVTPPCQHAALCGGCDFQHIDVNAHANLLTNVLRDTYRRIGKIELMAEVQAMGEPFGWRTRMNFAVDDDQQVSMRGSRSHDLVPIEQCLIAHPDLPKVWESSATNNEAFCAVSSTRQSTTDPLTVLTERVFDIEFEHSAGGFWQVHPKAGETLVDAVLRLGKPKPGERVIDLYSGAGLFTAFLAKAVGIDGSVLAIEQSQEAVVFAQENLHEFSQVELVCAKVADVELGLADLIVLDPPRSGAKAIIGSIIAAQPSRIVYVSCDVATGARDLRRLIDAGYELGEFEAYALFPMTAHIETVAVLTR